MICQLYPNSELIDEDVIIRNVISVMDSSIEESITKDEAICSLKDRIRNVVYNYIDAKRRKFSLNGFNNSEKESWLNEFINRFLLVNHKNTKVTCFRLKQYLNSNPRPDFDNWINANCYTFIHYKIMCEGLEFGRKKVLDTFFIRQREQKEPIYFHYFENWIAYNFSKIQKNIFNTLGIICDGAKSDTTTVEITKAIADSFVSDVNTMGWLRNAIFKNVDFGYSYEDDKKLDDKVKQVDIKGQKGEIMSKEINNVKVASMISFKGYMKKYAIEPWLRYKFYPRSSTNKKDIEEIERQYEYDKEKHESYAGFGTYNEKMEAYVYPNGFIPNLHTLISIDDDNQTEIKEDDTISFVDDDSQTEKNIYPSITDSFEEKELQKIRLVFVRDFLEFVEPKKPLVGRLVREYFDGQTEEIYEILKPPKTDFHLTGKEKTKAEKHLPKAIEDYSKFKNISKNKLVNMLLHGKYE